MTERPILFSAPMVRALLAGAKTQTRRVVKFDGLLDFEQGPDGVWRFRTEGGTTAVRCPYGKPGDTLWVRETWSHTGEGVWTIADARYNAFGGKVVYRATDDNLPAGSWWPSIHMPREFSRIALRVTDVRVERLNEISLEDVQAEGCEVRQFWLFGADAAGRQKIGAAVYRTLWNEINGPGSWAANPWVWAVTFQRVQP